MKTQATFNTQRGLTLVELMISLVISLVLMLGIVSTYATSKRGYKIQNEMARQQENGRFAVEMLTRDLRMAGYPKEKHHDAFVVANTSDGGGSVNDIITVQYESTTDCLGQPTPANSCSPSGSGQCAINRYYIDGNNDLVCLGNGGVAAEAVVERIDRLQIMYGIDTDIEPDGIANIYATWNNVTAAQRTKIVSVHFGLLASTPEEIHKANRSVTHTVLDQTITSNDKRIHRAYSTTVGLRNLR